jgi:hypothetical protein
MVDLRGRRLGADRWEVHLNTKGTKNLHGGHGGHGGTYLISHIFEDETTSFQINKRTCVNQIFEFTSGGFPGPFFRVQLIDHFLCCEKTDEKNAFTSYSVNILNNAAWNDLITYLETRKWKGDYKDPGVLDGTQWELLVNLPSTKLEAMGSNKYPPGYFKLMKLMNKIFEEVGVVVY